MAYLIQTDANGKAVKRHELLGQPVTFGRGPVDVLVDDPLMSRVHFRIEWRDGQYFLRDLGSSNGTLHNGQTVNGDVPLRFDDKIVAGETSFIFT